jgi:plasmid stabilization system protein ParE
MAHRVVWSTRALADVDAIAAYIAADSTYYAGTVVRKILSLTRTLAAFPLAGRKVPEFDDENFRELFAYSYRVIYRVEQDVVTVVAVIHGKRML